MMFTSQHFTDADSVLRTLIIGLGGFSATAALFMAFRNFRSWKRLVDRQNALVSLLFGLVLVSFAGLSALTTDHIYKHLLSGEAAEWQLWLALTSFTVGAATLFVMLNLRFEQKKKEPI